MSKKRTIYVSKRNVNRYASRSHTLGEVLHRAGVRLAELVNGHFVVEGRELPGLATLTTMAPAAFPIRATHALVGRAFVPLSSIRLMPFPRPDWRAH